MLVQHGKPVFRIAAPEFQGIGIGFLHSLADLTADVEGRTDEKRTDAQQYGAQQHHGCFPPGMFHTLFFLSVRNR